MTDFNPELNPETAVQFNVNAELRNDSSNAKVESDPKYQCRMYENEFPAVEDIIMVNVRQIADMGAYVNLMEYGDREGMILLSELSRRRIRSIQKLIRVNKKEVVTVLRVDEEKGYIDLSKRRVSEEEIEECTRRFDRSKIVHSILRQVAVKRDVELIELYEKVGWPLYRKYGHAYDALNLANSGDETVYEGLDADEDTINDVREAVQKRMHRPLVKIRTQLELRYTGFEGITAIKKAIKAGQELSAEGVDISITYMAAPHYVVTVETQDQAIGFNAIERVQKAIKDTLTSDKWGYFKVEKEAKLVNEGDERELLESMAKAERENELVSGDEDDGDAAAASDDDI